MTKIYEVFEDEIFITLEPNDHQYKGLLVFFCGFNQELNIYQDKFLKILNEKFSLNPLKILIAKPPKFQCKENSYFGILNDYFKKLDFNKSDFVFKSYVNSYIEEGKIRYDISKSHIDEICDKINQEKEFVGKENIFLGGFSLGGHFSLFILERLKYKIGMVLIFNSCIDFYVEQLKIYDHNYYDTPFYLNYSLNDPVVPFDTAIKSLLWLRTNKTIKNKHYSIDKKPNHSLNFIKFFSVLENVLKMKRYQNNDSIADNQISSNGFEMYAKF